MAPPSQSGQGTPGAGETKPLSDSPTDAETSQDPIRISSGSTSSSNLNSWDGIIDDYFDGMTNIKLPQSHQSESNQGLSFTGIADSPHLRPHLSVNTDQREIINVTDTAEIETETAGW